MKTMNNEIWRPVKGYEGFYEISNKGRVKSLERIVERSNSRKQAVNERILKGVLNSGKYLAIALCNKGVVKNKNIHQLVAESFLNHKPCGHKLVVNHINFDRTDNRVENLEIVTNRENSNLKHLTSTSQYTGVSWNKANKKWIAIIFVNGKNKYLGLFTDEYKAHLAYESEIAQLNNPRQKQTSLNL